MESGGAGRVRKGCGLMGPVLSMAWGAGVAVTMAALKTLYGWRGHWPRVVGLVLVAGFVASLVALWHPVYRFTALLQMDAANKTRMLPTLRGEPVALSPFGGYDGQYYAQLACDPTLRTPELRTSIDSLPYRARRILVPALAWVLGGGRPGVAVQAYTWINIGCWFWLAVLLWRLLGADQWRGLAAWTGVMFASGTLVSVRFSLTDLPGLVLFVAAMAAVERGRGRSAMAWFGASLLARETMLVGAWGLVSKAWERAPGRLWHNGLMLVLAVLPLALWLVYVGWQVGPSGTGVRVFGWPGAGLIGDWREEWALVCTGENRLLVWASLLSTVALTVQAVFMVVQFRPDDRWWRVGAGYVVLMLVLGPAVWEGIAGAALRVLLPLLLVCNVMVVRNRFSSWWLLALNLSVGVGLMEMAPMPDEREMAAVRTQQTAVVLRAETGCYGPERWRESRWVWTEQDAEWQLQSWVGACAMEATLCLKMRALDERELVVSWAGGELWRGRVGKKWTPVRLSPLPVQDGRVTLNFRADSPAVREGTQHDARLLSVCLLNPRIELQPAPTGLAEGAGGAGQ